MLNPGKILTICLVLTAGAVQPATAVVQGTLDELARDVDRAESMRAVKNLQRTYAQYSQYGLWNEMADLFAREATYIFDDETIKGRKAIVLLTDGKDAGSHVSARSLLASASAGDTLIYSVFYTTGLPQERESNTGRRAVVGPSPDLQQQREKREKEVKARNKDATDFLEKLSESSAGRYYQSDLTNLRKTFERIADELRNQYRLGFYPVDDRIGSTHNIKVEVKRSDLTVSARSIYRLTE